MRLLEIIRRVPVAVAETDLSTLRFVSVNDVMCEKTGYCERELLSMRPIDLLIEEGHKGKHLARMRAFLSGEPEALTSDYPIRTRDGRILWVHIQANIIHEAGLPIRVQTLATDITERKRLELALAESEGKYRAIFENIQDIYYESSLDGRLLEVSPSVSRVSGYSREELKRLSLYDLYPDPRERDEVMRTFLEKGKVTDYEITLKEKDGSLRRCSVNASLLRDAAGNPDRIVGSMRDVTEQVAAREKMQQAEQVLKKAREELERRVQERTQALRESEQKYRAILESIEEGYYEVDLTGKLRFFNRSLCVLSGYGPEEISGMDMLRLVTPEVARQLRESYTEILRAGVPRKIAECTFLRKDGVPRTVQMSASLLRDAQGRPDGFCGILRDVTELLESRRERELLRERLLHVQKMESMGTLAGGITHDFNNLLMGIRANLELILQDEEASRPFRQELRDIETCIQDAARLTDQLLGYARKGSFHARPTDINGIIRKTASLFQRTWKEIRVNTRLESTWLVRADRGQMEQVLLNLYINAWQAMSGGGEMTIESGHTVLPETSMGATGLSPGRYVTVSVTDTGTGMDEATRMRVFDPFFTTKPGEKNTGLGLSSGDGIVRKHGGILTVKSRVGQGSTFTIYLPVLDPPAGSSGDGRR